MPPAHPYQGARRRSAGGAERSRSSVSVHDGPSTGITVTLPLFVLPPTWAAEQRDLLTRVREVCPREVVETSPGAWTWRRDRHS
ncbi:DUF5959 family protein [Streptomyces cathayae]|uniref:DUF5959 family protein n=1 Tax=Streptomyces cathayae TaxID=3031124 RepID=A0ABY8K5Q6_9ACTN|nr:DUF5959 family protein [Streptomyces sp. HUAS 5]WGD42191.1 DUF5959 family protein [Streptomyces sp. HUAS 5]